MGRSEIRQDKNPGSHHTFRSHGKFEQYPLSFKNITAETSLEVPQQGWAPLPVNLCLFLTYHIHLLIHTVS